MKLLMIYCTRFAYKTNMKTLDSIPDIDEKKEILESLAGFIQLEVEDENNEGYIETKLVKNLKWAARKNNSNKIILHSFAHLSDSKASPEFTKKIFDNTQKRLISSDYEVYQTPFGYFLDLDLQAPGHPLARLFKSI